MWKILNIVKLLITIILKLHKDGNFKRNHCSLLDMNLRLMLEELFCKIPAFKSLS
jgi:hypothetical protein